jgi:hypothetical protein
MMHQSIEMGRAENTSKTDASFLALERDNPYYLRFPEHKFLLGGVSISNQFSDFQNL